MNKTSWAIIGATISAVLLAKQACTLWINKSDRDLKKSLDKQDDLTHIFLYQKLRKAQTV